MKGKLAISAILLLTAVVLAFQAASWVDPWLARLEAAIGHGAMRFLLITVLIILVVNLLFSVYCHLYLPKPKRLAISIFASLLAFATFITSASIGSSSIRALHVESLSRAQGQPGTDRASHEGRVTYEAGEVPILALVAIFLIVCFLGAFVISAYFVFHVYETGLNPWTFQRLP